MKEFLTIILAAGFISGCQGCGKPEIYGTPSPTLENQLKQQLTDDLARIGKRIDFSGITFTFYSDHLVNANGKTRNGVCDYGTKNISLHIMYPEIYVNFIHELGHCKCGLSHDDSAPNIMTTEPDLTMMIKLVQKSGDLYLAEWARRCGL